eukprot:UC4_evm5s566
MTSYTKIVKALPQVENAIATLEGPMAASLSPPDKKRIHDEAFDILQQHQPKMEKLTKQARETDPDKIIFSEDRKNQIIKLAERFDLALASLTAARDSFQDEYSNHIAHLEAKKAQEAAAEAKRKAAADAAAARASAEAEAAQNAAAEAERRASEEKAAAMAEAVAKRRAEAERKAALKMAKAAEREAAAEAAAAAERKSEADRKAREAEEASKFKINVKVVPGTPGPETRAFQVILPLAEKSTVLQLKQAIHEQFNQLDVEKQLIIAVGKKLEGDTAISTVGLKSGSTVHLGIKRDTSKPASISSPAATTSASSTSLTSSSTTNPSLATRSREQVVEACLGGLRKIKQECGDEDFRLAMKTVYTLLANALDKPNNPVYRRVRLGNSALHERLFSKTGGIESLEGLGFVKKKDNGGEDILVLEDINPCLAQVRELLKNALGINEPFPQPSVSNQQPPITASNPWAAAFGGQQANNSSGGAFPGFPGFGLGGSTGSDTMSSGNTMLEQLRNNPMMQQMQQQMMQNPQMMAEMMNSPIMQNLLNNPDQMRSVMESFAGPEVTNNPMFQMM